MGDHLDRVKRALADLELAEIAPLLTEALEAGLKAPDAVEAVRFFSGRAS